MKTNIIKLREEIKEEVKKQKFYKNQCKDKFLVGEREMEQFRAQMNAYYQKQKLRFLYAAYGILRGKPFSITESKYDAGKEHPLMQYSKHIIKIVNQYADEEVVCVD